MGNGLLSLEAFASFSTSRKFNKDSKSSMIANVPLFTLFRMFNKKLFHAKISTNPPWRWFETYSLENRIELNCFVESAWSYLGNSDFIQFFQHLNCQYRQKSIFSEEILLCCACLWEIENLSHHNKFEMSVWLQSHYFPPFWSQLVVFLFRDHSLPLAFVFSWRHG